MSNQVSVQRAFMSVTLISARLPGFISEEVNDCTPVESVVAVAAAKSHRSKPRRSLIEKCINLGHESVLEHASFTFDVKNVSRALLAQLTRHRLASYTVESQRYVDYTKEPLRYILPKAIELKGPEAVEIFDDFMKTCANKYAELIEMGFKPEDARSVLPQATACDLVFTMNARELRHACDLRIDSHAQDEIRQLFKRCLWQAAEQGRALFSDKLYKFRDELDEFISRR